MLEDEGRLWEKKFDFDPRDFVERREDTQIIIKTKLNERQCFGP